MKIIDIFKNAISDYARYRDIYLSLHVITLLTEKQSESIKRISKVLPKSDRIEFLSRTSDHCSYGRSAFVAAGYSLQEIWDKKNKK